MCVLFLFVDPEPSKGHFRLILATNRDESFKRDSIPARKDEESNIIGGLDMEPGVEGGMWFGIKVKQAENGNKKLCIGTLLNIIGGLQKEFTHRRGIIVKNYLQSSSEFPDYIKELESERSFGGYHLVGVELDKENSHVYRHCNMPIEDNVYTGKHTIALGNTPPYCPFTKVLKGRYKFQEIIAKELEKEELIEELLMFLKNRTKYLPDPELERRAPSSFELLSSLFINSKSREYGTRTHSIVLVDYTWKVDFIEHTMKEPIDSENPEWIVTHHELQL